MELDLRGRTVTQAINYLEAAFEEAAGEELTLSIDNEAVKLNLYNYIHKTGMVCRTERKGSLYLIRIKVPRKKPGAIQTPKKPTAFPVNHISGKNPPPPAPKPVQRPAPAATKQPSKSPPKPAMPKPAAAPATAKPARKRPPQPPKPESFIKAPLPETESAKSWLVIQQDQIGQREVALGQELLEDILENLNTANLEGIFLIHRGVRLLDPSYNQGRFLQSLLRLKVDIKACARSLAYFNLMDEVDDDLIEIVPAHNLARLWEKHPLIWM